MLCLHLAPFPIHLKPFSSTSDMSWLCVSLLTLWFAAASQALCVDTNEEDQYGVILDAGSSGTKLKVYKWQKPKRVTEVPNIQEVIRHGRKFTPGIGHYTKRPADLPSYLEDILKAAKESVPENRRACTPIYLMATAGARILDGNIALGLLNQIRNVLSNHTINPFRFKGNNVRILSGEEEAVFAWVALNALNGFFNTSKPATESLGLLEMGGGSTQIAFVPYEPMYAGEFQVFIGGRRFDLYVHSYLFYGANYMRQRINNYLMSINSGAEVIHNPCRLAGHDITVLSENKTKVNVLGDSDPVECTKILRRFLSRTTEDKCYPKPCAIGSVYQPRVGNTSFYATQAFVYTPQTMSSYGPNKLLNITKLRREANIYCSKSLKEVNESYNVKEKYASDECMMGLYLPILMLDAYQMDPEMNSVTVSNKINNKRIDWTLGAILYEVNMMFQSKRLLPQKTAPCVPKAVSYETKPKDGTNSATSSYTVFPGTILACITAGVISAMH